jgi:hypothetical protein
MKQKRSQVRPRSEKKIRGVYFRPEMAVFYFARMRNGKRVRVNLETADYAQAIERAAAIQDAPELNEAGGWETEINAFIVSKLSRNIWSKNSADSKREREGHHS